MIWATHMHVTSQHYFHKRFLMIPHMIHATGPLSLIVLVLLMIGCQHNGMDVFAPTPEPLQTFEAPAEHPEAAELFKQADAIRTDARRIVDESKALQQQATEARRIAEAIQHADAEHATLSPPPGL